MKTRKVFLAISLFLLSVTFAPAESVKNQVEQVLSVFDSSEFVRAEVLDRKAFSRTALHEETTYIVTDKASRKYRVVFTSKAGFWGTSAQGKKIDVISKEISLRDYKTGEVLLSENNPCPLQKGRDVGEYGSFPSQEFIGKLNADNRVSIAEKAVQTPVPSSEPHIELPPQKTNAEIKTEKPSATVNSNWVKSPISNECTWVAGNGCWRIAGQDKDLRALFDELNNTYFSGLLKLYSVGWNCDMKKDILASTWYYETDGKITITFNYDLAPLKDPKTLRAVMLHEMCHVVQYMIEPTHTLHCKNSHEEKLFNYEKDRLIKYFNEWVW